MTTEKNNDYLVNQLCVALLNLKDLDESKNFIVDLCTTTEIHTLAQRLEVAKLLNEGHTYDYVEETTGASTATISRIKRFLKHGNGYKTVLDRISTNNKL